MQNKGCEKIHAALTRTGFNNRTIEGLFGGEHDKLLRDCLVRVTAGLYEEMTFEDHLDDRIRTAPLQPIDFSVSEWLNFIDQRNEQEGPRITLQNRSDFFRNHASDFEVPLSPDTNTLLVVKRSPNSFATVDEASQYAEKYLAGCTAQTRAGLLFELMRTLPRRATEAVGSYVIVPRRVGDAGGLYPILFNTDKGMRAGFINDFPRISHTGSVAFCGTTH